MIEKEFYLTIQQPGVAEFKDRGSRFIAYAYPVESVDVFKNYLQQLKKEHPKAVHHCFAYRLGLDGMNFRSSDDGEPSGTAGKPILGQIDSRELTNILIVVVRYFGGTLLGVPGLINAYRTAAAMVLQVTPVVRKAVEVNYQLHFNYTHTNDVMVIVKKYNCTVIQQDSQLFCEMTVGVPISRLQEFLFRLSEMPAVELQKLPRSV
jgi:uncharacterized YigZ family protein